MSFPSDFASLVQPFVAPAKNPLTKARCTNMKKISNGVIISMIAGFEN
jgi:hypothetical protein